MNRILIFGILTTATVQSASYDRYNSRSQYDLDDDGYLEHPYSDQYGSRYPNTDYNTNYPNQNIYPDSQYPNSQYPNSQYPNSQYPNSQYPNSQYPNSQYPNSQYPNSQYPNSQYPDGQYPSSGSIYPSSYPGAEYPNNDYSGRYGSGYQDGYDPYGTGTGTACVDRTPQTAIEMDRLMGMWYGVEYIQHLTGDSRIHIDRYNCIVVHIAETWDDRDNYGADYYHVERLTTEWRREYRHLKLVWTENNKIVEYPLYFRNQSIGVWKAAGSQNGSLVNDPRYAYKQFSGTVQVLKAVGDHLLLNFCQEQSYDRPAQLFSVLLAREPLELRRWEIEAAHSLLQLKRLSTASRRLVCGNGAFSDKASLTLTLMVSILAFFAFKLTH